MSPKIEISPELLRIIKKRKTSSEDTYEDVIWNLIEDKLELSKETKRDIEIARKILGKESFTL